MTFSELISEIKNWLKYYKSKWLIILLSFLIGSVIGVVYSILKKPQYVAKISFVLDDEKGSSGISGAIGLASQFGFDLGQSGGSAFSGTNITELIKSRRVIENTLLTEVEIKGIKKSLADYFIDFEGWRENIELDSNLYDIGNFNMLEKKKGFSIQKDSIITEIYKTVSEGMLAIGLRDKKLSIFDAEMKATNDFFAKLFLECLLNEVSRFYIETKTKKANSNVLILQRQVDSVRYELNKAMQGVSQALDQTFNLNAASSINRIPSQKRQIEVQANSVILTELVKNLELSKIALLKQTPLIQIIDYPVFPLDKIKLGKRKGLLFGSLILTSFVIILLGILHAYRIYVKNLHSI